MSPKCFWKRAAKCFSCNTPLLVAMINACGGSGEGEHGPKRSLSPFSFRGRSYLLNYGRPPRCPSGATCFLIAFEKGRSNRNGR